MAQCDSDLLAGPQYTRNTWAMAHFKPVGVRYFKNLDRGISDITYLKPISSIGWMQYLTSARVIPPLAGIVPLPLYAPVQPG